MKLSQRLSALIYVLVPALVFAPVSYAAETTPTPTPLNYDFVFTLDGGRAELAFKKVEDGYLYWPVSSGQSPKLLTNEQVEEASPQPVDDGSRYRTALQDGLGGYHEYFIVPDAATEGLTGRVESGDSQSSSAYSLRFADTSATPAARTDGRLRTEAVVLVVVIGAAAIGAIGCAWNALITNCATECSRACRYGMQSSSEGLCGQCTCVCFPPPQTY